mmetsp:Transcript_18601/g.42789  ORF Transcript_18601/g.42789 Transcript_18601/m.42789 type:complete len:228 (+) Transcript_18601:658-1341(+)
MRGLDGSRCRLEHLQGRNQLDRCRLWSGSCGPRRGPGCPDGRSLQDHCRRRQSRQVRDGQAIGSYRLRQSQDARGRSGTETHCRDHDRLGRGLQLRLHRKCRGDAKRTRVRPPRMGNLLHHRCRRVRPRDQHPALPAGDRPHLEGNRLWGIQEPDRRAQARRAHAQRQNQDRPLYHPHLLRSGGNEPGGGRPPFRKVPACGREVLRAKEREREKEAVPDRTIYRTAM